MTIAIGLIFKPKKPTHPLMRAMPQIYMASDSQTTYGSTKRENPNKLSVVNFVNGQILIAQADSVEVGDRTIEKIKAKAARTKMEDSETAIRIVREALREVRQELVEWNKGCNTDAEKLFWTEHRLTLLVGYFFKEEPLLFKIDIYSGIYKRVQSFEAIGGGESLGYFLLKEYSQSDPDFDYPMPIAISVTEKVIDNIDGCGQPVWVGYVYPIPEEHQGPNPFFGCAGLLGKEDVEMVSEELKKSDSHHAAMRKEEIIKVMKKVGKKFLRLFIKKQTSHERFERLRNSKK